MAPLPARARAAGGAQVTLPIRRAEEPVAEEHDLKTGPLCRRLCGLSVVYLALVTQSSRTQRSRRRRRRRRRRKGKERRRVVRNPEEGEAGLDARCSALPGDLGRRPEQEAPSGGSSNLASAPKTGSHAENPTVDNIPFQKNIARKTPSACEGKSNILGDL
ncbi:hypothetical protein SKAU_G00038060 [Synaphobranchus kaupii]|uniref:Uncharacterized protein n=1 Tax=Synaphobranchus kaupii TaxID=118154 RepID=A0A9Q1GGM0_SYNKA|nr:hypothetical protein SKAU_G00038060 [Synaphobranchus kaupii]